MKKKADEGKGKPAMQGTIELYLIEHGGAPFLTTGYEDGASSTSPQFPDPLPTLAQAMKQYPCKGHGERKPNVCKEAKKLARAH
jgi:hypothetical protein